MGKLQLCAVLSGLAVACGSGGGNSIDADPSTIIDADPSTIIDAVPSPDGIVVGGDAGNWTCFPTFCAGKELECNDCIDNDGDGEVDSRDQECLGPCDNTEGPGLESGVGGTTGNSCGVDCYFDYGNGPGNDECIWDHRCDMEAPEDICPYDADLVGGNQCPATQDPTCAEVCGPFTPNGCDCFGCCTFPNAAPGGTGPRNVWIGNMDGSNNSTCTFANLTDETACPTCTPVANCYNPCDMCEVCIGAPLPDPSCTGGQQCPGGEQPCGLDGQAECASGFYCVSGCCQEVIVN